MKKTKKLYYQKEIENNSRIPKGTWNVLNDLMGKNTKNIQITKLNKSPSETITDAKCIADHLNTHFTEIDPKLALQIPPTSQGKTFPTMTISTKGYFQT